MACIGALRAQKYRIHCFHLPVDAAGTLQWAGSRRFLQNSQGARAWLAI